MITNGAIHTKTGAGGSDAEGGSGTAGKRAGKDAVAPVEAKEGSLVLFAGLLPICRHCFKPRMNCDCDVAFEPLRESK